MQSSYLNYTNAALDEAETKETSLKFGYINSNILHIFNTDSALVDQCKLNINLIARFYNHNVDLATKHCYQIIN